MGNVRKMGENRIIEQQRSDKNYRTTKKIRRKIRYFFFIPSEENRIIEQQGTVNNRTFVLLNFRSIIPALTIYIYVCVFVCVISIIFNYTVQYLLVDWRAIGWMVRCQAIRKAISLLKSPFHPGPGWWWWWFSIDKLRRYLSGGLLYKTRRRMARERRGAESSSAVSMATLYYKTIY